MKKLIIYYSVFIVISLLKLYGQDSYKFVGQVVDVNNKLSLSNVSVFCHELNKTLFTDDNGNFEIDFSKKGIYTFTLSRIGYKKVSHTINIEKFLTEFRFEMKENPLPGQSVIVTAMRSEKRTTPLTFSDIESEELEKRYTVQDLPLILSELPSSTFYSESGNGIGYNYVNIRGFDQRRISVMINGVPQNDPEDHNIYWIDFPDLVANLDNIQVQRAAGSAFYGPASIGGSINLITSNFAKTKGISLFAGYGSYNTKKYSFLVNSGIIADKYSFYGRLSRITTSGYRDNSWSQLNSYFLGAIRYDQNLTTQIHIYGGPISDHLAYYGIEKAYIKDKDKRKTNYIARPEETESFSQPHYEFLQEWKINDNITFNHTIFFIEGEGYFIYDASWADTSYFRLTSEYGFKPARNVANSLIKANVHNKQYGWMPRVNYVHKNGELTFGLELRNHRSLHWGGLNWAENLPEGLNPDYRFYEYKGGKDIFSVYAHELYNINSKTNLLLNIQYCYNRYKIFDEKFVGTDFSVPYHFINPLIGINYNLNEYLNSYFTVSYVSREPRLKNLYDAGAERDGATPQFELKSDGSYNFDKPLVIPERLLDVELGVGFNRENINTTCNLYWMEFKDEIVKSGQLDRFGQPITGNAERTRHIGCEVTFLYNFFEYFSISGNFTISKNEIIKNKVYKKLLNPLTNKKEMMEIILDGNRISGFPDFLSNLKLIYSKDNLSATLLMQYSGDKYTDNFGDLAIRPYKDNKVDDYVVFNFDVSYKLSDILGIRGIIAKLQINNIFNKLYATHGEGNEFFPAAERNAFFSINLDL